MKSVAIVYGYHKSGHFTAAKALKSEFDQKGYDSSIHNIWQSQNSSVDALFSVFRDVVQFQSPIFPDFMLEPNFLSTIAESIDVAPSILNADILVSTHPYSTFVLASKVGNRKVASVHTDFTPFPVIQHENVFLYTGCFPKSDLPAHVANRVYGTGIPTNIEANNSVAKEDRIAVMGGADGFGNIVEILDYLREIAHNYEFDVVCGRNEELRRRVKENSRTKVYGFVEDLEPVYAKSKFVFTKGSGLTITEALNTQNIPILSPTLLPWEHEASIQIAGRGIGIYLESFASDEYRRFLTQLFGNDTLQEFYIQRGQRALPKNPVKEIVRLVETRSHETRPEAVENVVRSLEERLGNSSDLLAKSLKEHMEKWSS